MQASINKILWELTTFFASGAVVGRATTHEWGRPSLHAARSRATPKVGIDKFGN